HKIVQLSFFPPFMVSLVPAATAWRSRRSRLALAASRFGHLGWLVFALLKPINRPPPPTLGHSRNRKQPLGFIAITGVAPKYGSDGETMSWPLDYPDLITRAYSTLDD